MRNGDPLAGPEQNRSDVERELVDDPRDKRLPHSPGAPRDVHAVIGSGFARLSQVMANRKQHRRDRGADVR